MSHHVAVTRDPSFHGAETRVVVLDFDGTLVDSNEIKRAAYFPLFSDDQRTREVVAEVLRAHFERSRFEILGIMVDRLGLAADFVERERVVDELALRYDIAATEGARTCPQIAGAEEMLFALHRRYALYLSSTTPIESLRAIVVSRGWFGYFRDIYGYPADKTDSLKTILVREEVAPSQVVVFGDGESDRSSAVSVGCRFVRAGGTGDIKSLRAVLGC